MRRAPWCSRLPQISYFVGHRCRFDDDRRWSTSVETSYCRMFHIDGFRTKDTIRVDLDGSSILKLKDYNQLKPPLKSGLGMTPRPRLQSRASTRPALPRHSFFKLGGPEDRVKPWSFSDLHKCIIKKYFLTRFYSLSHIFHNYLFLLNILLKIKPRAYSLMGRRHAKIHMRATVNLVISD